MTGSLSAFRFLWKGGLFMVLILIWPRVTFQLKVNRRSRPAAFFSFSFPLQKFSWIGWCFFLFFSCLGPFCQLTPFLFSFLQPLLLFHPQTFKTFISILVRAHYYIQSPAPPLHLFIVLLYSTEGIGRRER